jgi:hypothetical protein
VVDDGSAKIDLAGREPLEGADNPKKNTSMISPTTKDCQADLLVYGEMKASVQNRVSNVSTIVACHAILKAVNRLPQSTRTFLSSLMSPIGRPLFAGYFGTTGLQLCPSITHPSCPTGILLFQGGRLYCLLHKWLNFFYLELLANYVTSVQIFAKPPVGRRLQSNQKAARPAAYFLAQVFPEEFGHALPGIPGCNGAVCFRVEVAEEGVP